METPNNYPILPDQTPSNRNFLSPLNFKFMIKKTPYVNFFVQRVKIPGVSMGSLPRIPNPLVNIPVPSDHLTFGQLDISFKLDEDMQDYYEIFNWIIALGKPRSFQQYAQIEKVPKWTGQGIYSDLSVMVLDNLKTPKYEFVFKDAFPTDIGDINFNTTDLDVQYMESSASFAYTYFELNKIPT